MIPVAYGVFTGDFDVTQKLRHLSILIYSERIFSDMLQRSSLSIPFFMLGRDNMFFAFWLFIKQILQFFCLNSTQFDQL